MDEQIDAGVVLMARGPAGRQPSRRGHGASLAAAVVMMIVVAVTTACGSSSDAASSSPPADTSTPPSAVVTPSTDTPAPTPESTPPAPAPPADPCHAGGVTYCVLNPDVTQATIGSTICVSGWTASVRPPESYTYNLKKQQMAQEGLPGSTSNYEEDHRMPLELGGAPRDVMNLSPESPPSHNPKDSNETSLKYDVCDGRMTLVQAQAQMVSTWLAAYPGYKR